MFEIANLEPWVGRDYGHQLPKIMVVGETRYGDWTDREIGENLCLPSELSNTWSGFAKAATGDLALTLANRVTFLQRIVFYNYVVNFQPKTAAESAVASGQRNDPDNQRVLLEMIEHYQPSHLIIWGVPNFRTVVAGPCWQARALGEEGLAYAHVAIGSVRAVAIGIKHPAIGFSYRAWAPVVADFLSGGPDWRPSMSATEAWLAALPSPGGRATSLGGEAKAMLPTGTMPTRPARPQGEGKTLLLRLLDGEGARPWVVKEYTGDDGVALIDQTDQVVRGNFTARVKEKIVEALNVLLNEGAFDGVSGFSYHGDNHVAVVRGGRVVLVEGQ